MADRQIGNIHGLPIRSGTLQNGGSNATTGFSDTDLNTVAAMRTRLAAINAGVYTAERLNLMTTNDMVYAIRVADNAGTI